MSDSADYSSLVVTLREAGCVFAEDEARILLEATQGEELSELLARRIGGEPLEQVVGWVDFAGLRLNVVPGVFVPRQRTALLAEQTMRVVMEVVDSLGSAANLGANNSGTGVTFLEAFCGVGPVAASVARTLPETRIHFGDADPGALVAAAHNTRGTAHVLDCLHGLPDYLHFGIDVIAAVPPYVPETAAGFLPREAADYEPRAALFGGTDGLDLVRRLVVEAPEWLSAGGTLLIELGYEQASMISDDLTGTRVWAVRSHLGEDKQTVVLELRRRR